jgi:2-polyprenyl-3-methyl-5-hydroxy-6-metoxy-1,4-benzoquinol methylase
MKIRKRKLVFKGIILFSLGILLLSPIFSQSKVEDEKTWVAFKDWIINKTGQVSLKAYGEKLAKDGLAQAEIQKQINTIKRLLKDNPVKGVELTYDKIFSKPLTGDPKKDGFTSTPSLFMMEATKELKPGKALDVGAGQGRNAVWLALKGWEVTGIDISSVGLAKASANAKKAGTSIRTVKTTYQDYDFGNDKWDLIVMILSWAPVSDPTFVARLNASLRPGGILVFEHVLETKNQSFPAYVHGLAPNALLKHFKNFHIQKYEEGVWPGDWGGPPADLVRMIAIKK